MAPITWRIIESIWRSVGLTGVHSFNLAFKTIIWRSGQQSVVHSVYLAFRMTILAFVRFNWRSG
ncbi:hypothetical protein HNO89_002277 [Sporosarcina luteola]|nr:hypothetical protein [Sporosarcina luteola]